MTDCCGFFVLGCCVVSLLARNCGLCVMKAIGDLGGVQLLTVIKKALHGYSRTPLLFEWVSICTLRTFYGNSSVCSATPIRAANLIKIPTPLPPVL
jgi:hypothetical protein